MGLAVTKQEYFWEACGFGDQDLVKLYIDEGIDVNWVSHTHNSCPIHVASQGKEEIVKMLIEAKCDVNVEDERGALAIHHAAMKGFPEIMKHLISAGSKVEIPDKNGWTPLIYAAYYCQLECLNLLLKTKVCVDYDNKDDRTALHEVSRSQCDDEEQLGKIAQSLIEAGAELDKRSSDLGGADFTPLMFAAYHGHPKVAETLCGANCDINLQGSNGWTALHWAANKNRKDVITTLLGAGANPTIKDRSYCRAVDRTTEEEIKDILRKATFEWKTKHGEEKTSPVKVSSSNGNIPENQPRRASHTGNVGDLVKYMLLGPEIKPKKVLPKRRRSMPGEVLVEQVSLAQVSIKDIEGEIGFMDEDEEEEEVSSPVSPADECRSVSTESESSAKSDVLESKSEIENTEKIDTHKADDSNVCKGWENLELNKEDKEKHCKSGNPALEVKGSQLGNGEISDKGEPTKLEQVDTKAEATNE